MPYKVLTAAQRDNAVACALTVTAAAIRGDRTYNANGHHFDLRETGWCQKNVRAWVECGNHWPPASWEFGDDEPSAKVALQHMDAAGLRLPKGALLVPGDIVGHRRGTWGHIGLVAIDEHGTTVVCENTSSAMRGNPRRAGTKRTPLADFPAEESYRLVSKADAGVFVNGENVYPVALLIDGRCYVPRRITADALGAELEPLASPDCTVNGQPITQIIRNGIGWVWARDLARLTGCKVAWSPGRIDLTT